MDITTILGLVFAFGSILGGQVLEGGHISSIMQGTAALIVFGGTIGCVFITWPLDDIKTAMSCVGMVFSNPKGANSEKVIEELIAAAQTARKESILALEKQLTNFSHPFMQTVFRFVIDGVDPATIRDIFENKIALEEEHLKAGGKFFEDMGAFAPTIGIIGAVLGLIHVMENLADTSKLGSGIAVAFVATVYGVAGANIVFLPFGKKIGRKIKNQGHMKTMILEGALGIVGGLNPFIIEEKLRAYSHGHGPKKPGGEH